MKTSVLILSVIKKIFFFISIIMLLASCSTDDENEAELEFYIDIQNLSTQSFDLNKLGNESLSFDIDVVGYNKTKLETVTLHAIFKDVDDYPNGWRGKDSIYSVIDLKKISTFPSVINLSIEDLFNEIPDFSPIDLLNGDQFEFFFSMQFIDNNNLIRPKIASSLCQELNQLETEKCSSFFVDFICKYEPADILGTWEVYMDESGYRVEGEGSEELEIIAGPGENQVTILNVFNSTNPETNEKDYNIVLDIDPSNNSIGVKSQTAWYYQVGDDGWRLTGWVQGEGFVSTCTKELEMTLGHVAYIDDTGICDCGVYVLSLRKKL